MKLEPKPTNLKIAQLFNILCSAIDCSKSFFENLLKLVSDNRLHPLFFLKMVLNQVWEKNIGKTYTRLMSWFDTYKTQIYKDKSKYFWYFNQRLADEINADQSRMQNTVRVLGDSLRTNLGIRQPLESNLVCGLNAF